MKLYDKTKWIIVFAVLAVFAVTGIAADSFIAGKLYKLGGQFAGSIFTKVLPAIPLVLCSFSGAVMMSCRNTRGTRKKNTAMTVLCGLLSYAFAFAAAYYPFISVKNVDLFIIGAIALAISGSGIFLSFTSFKYTDQKIAMMCFAKRTIISTLIIGAVCGVALLLPQRVCYDSVMQNIAMTGSPEGPYSQTIPVLPFASAGAPVLMNIFFFKDAIPKLKFSGKTLYVIPCLWIILMVAGMQLSGEFYLSEAVYGALAGSMIVLLVSKILEKTEI